MTRRSIRSRRDGLSTVAGFAMLLSLATLGASAVGAARIERLPEPESTAGTSVGVRADASARAEHASSEDIAAAVESNPFSPSRRPPAVAFTLAGGAGGSPMEPDEPPTYGGPQPELVGIARRGQTGFVLASYPGEESRIVRPGESIGGWTLEKVAESRAVFRSADGERIELELGHHR